MSLFLRVLSLQSSRTVQKSCVRVVNIPSSCFTTSCRINFNPRTSNVVAKIEKTTQGQNWPVPEDFTLIYEYENNLFFRASAFTLFIGSFAFGSLLHSGSSSETEEGNEPVSSNSVPDGNAKLPVPRKILFILGMFILSIPVVIGRRLVLASFRNGDDYITFVNRWFGIKSIAVHHGPEHCFYHQGSKLFQHEISGLRLIMFSTCFKSKDDEIAMFPSSIICDK